MYEVGDGIAIGGLADGGVYYVVIVDETTVQLAESKRDALAEEPRIVDIDGSDIEGNRHSFKRVTNSSLPENTIELGYAHGFRSGQAVVYQSGDSESIDGLVSGDVYYVVETSPTSIALATSQEEAEANDPELILLDASPASGARHSFEAVFDPATAVASSADSEEWFIRLGYDLGLEPGDAVIYRSGSAAAIGGLTDGDLYYVLKPASESLETEDGTEIQLALPESRGTAIVLDAEASDGLAHRIERAYEISSAVDDAKDVIDLGYIHRMVSGDAVVYSNGGGINLGGLEDGRIYYAVVDGNESTTMRLASSRGNALARSPEDPLVREPIVLDLDASGASGNRHQFDKVFNPFARARVVGDAIDLGYDHGFITGQAVVYRIGADTSAIGGLTPGDTYYVMVGERTSIALSKTRAGTDPSAPEIIQLDASVAGGAAHGFDAVVEDHVFSPIELGGIDAETIDLGYAHGFITGDAVVYRSGGGTPIDGLADGQTYYVIVEFELEEDYGDPDLPEYDPADDPGPSTRLSLSPTREGTNPFEPTRILLDATVASGTGHGLDKVVYETSDDGEADRIDLGYAHGFETGQAVVYRSGGGVPFGGLVDGEVYFVVVINRSTIELAASRVEALSDSRSVIELDLSEAEAGAHSFQAVVGFTTAVDRDSDAIHFDSPHGLSTSQSVVYDNGGGVDIGGLTSGETYYVVALDSNSLLLANTREDAISGEPTLEIDSTDAEGNHHSLVPVFVPSADVDGDENSIDLGYVHGFGTGRAVVYSSGDGATLGGLVDGEVYYVIAFPDSNEVKLADTAAGARSGIAIDLDPSVADGDAHSLLATAVVEAQGTVDVSAQDVSVVTAAAGAFGGSGKGAVGATLATNVVVNHTRAYIEGAVVTSFTDDVLLDSSSVGVVTAGTAAIAGAGKWAIGGALSTNVEVKRIDAHISGGSTVEAFRNVVINASDISVVTAPSLSLAAAGKVGVGAALSANVIVNKTTAYIDDSDVISSDGGINLNAASVAVVTAPTFGGGGGGTFGFGGSLALNVVVNTTSAYISNGADVEATGDIGAMAIDTSVVTAVAGGIAGAGKAAIGAGVATNVVVNDIFAYIDDAEVSSLLGDVGLDATSNAVVSSVSIGGAGAGTFALGGAVSVNVVVNEVEAHISNSAWVMAEDVALQARDLSIVTAASGALAGAGNIAIGASIANNNVINATRAHIDGATVEASGNVSLDALSTGVVTTVGIAGSGAGTVAISGSFAVNVVVTTTDAYISNDANVTSTAAPLIGATGDPTPKRQYVFNPDSQVDQDYSIELGYEHGLTTGDAVIYRNGGGESIGGLTDGETYYVIVIEDDEDESDESHSTALFLAASQADAEAGLNIIPLDVSEAEGNVHRVEELGDSGASARASISLKAEDRSIVSAVAGSVSGAGTAAIGASLANNNVITNTSARIEGSTITADQDVELIAGSVAVVTSVAIAGGGAGTFSANGSLAANIVVGKVDAHISDGSDVVRAAAVRLSADDLAVATAFAGNLGGAGAVAIGGSGSLNTVVRYATAFIEASTLGAVAGAVELDAGSLAIVTGIAAGGTGAGAVAIQGSAAVNVVVNTQDAHVSDLASITADALRIEASDLSIVTAVAGTGSGAGVVSIGVAAANNNVINTTRAYIDGATVSTTGAVELDASSLPVVSVVGISGGGAGVFSGTGSLGVNVVVTTVDAHISDHNSAHHDEDLPRGARSNIDASEIRIAAKDLSIVTAVVGTGGGAGAVAIGATVANNSVIRHIQSAIEGSTLTAREDVALEAQSLGVVTGVAIGGIGAGGVALVGSGVVNVVVTTIDSHISDDSIVTSTAPQGAKSDNAAPERQYVFNPGTRVDVETDDSIDFGFAHGLETGDAVIYRSGGGTSIGGLTNGETYYVIALDVDGDPDNESQSTAIRLASTQELAEAGTALGLDKSVAGGTTHSLELPSSGAEPAADAISLKATDISIVSAVAGNGVGAGLVAIGASGANNNVISTTTAYIDDSMILAEGNVGVHATYVGVATAGAISGGGAGAFSGNASAAVNVVVGIVDAHVSAGSMVEAAGLDLTARDISVVSAIAGNAGGAGAVRIGGSLALNTVTKTTTSFIDASSVTTDGDVGATAESIAIVTGVAFGFGGAGGVAVQGSATVNVVVNTVDAHASNGSSLITGGKVGLEANDLSIVTAVAISGGGAGIGSFAGAAANNNVINTTRAYIDGTTVDAGEDVELRASSLAVVSAVGVSGGGAGGVSATGSLAVNVVVTNVDAHIGDHAVDFHDGEGSPNGIRSIVDASKILLAAEDLSIVTAVAGTGGGAGAGSIAAAAANNSVIRNIESTVEGSTLTTSGDLELRSKSVGVVTGVAVGGSGAGGVSLVGSGVVNVVVTTIDSHISDGSIVTSEAPQGAGGDDAAPDRQYVFNPATRVDLQTADSIDFGFVHGLETGDAVVYRSGGGARIDGLKDGETYYVIAVDDDADPENESQSTAIKLARTQALAVSGIAINLDESVAEGTTHSLEIPPSGAPPASDAIRLKATDVSIVSAVAGNGGGAGIAAIGASLANNNVISTTTAYIDDSTIIAEGNVAVGAASVAVTTAGGISGGGAGIFAGNGSAAVNVVVGTVDAHVSTRSVVEASGLDLTARDISVVSALAGNGGGAGALAIGGSLASNIVTKTTISFIDDSSITTVGDVSAKAESNSIVTGVAVGAVGAGGVSVQGSAVLNLVVNTVDTHVSNGSTLSAGGEVRLEADDLSVVSAVAGAGSGAGLASFNGAATLNTVTNTATAYIDDSVVSAAQVEVSARSLAVVTGVAVGGAGAGGVAVLGSGVVNVVVNTIDAHISNGSNVTSDGKVAVKAEDVSVITAFAGSGGGAGIASVGAAGANNNVINTTRAYIDNSTVAAGDDILITARRDATVDGTGIAGSAGGVVAAQAAAAIINDVSTTAAFIDGGTEILEADDVRVEAFDTRTFNAEVFGASVGGLLAAGASVATATAGGLTQAYIGNNVQIGKNPGKTVNDVIIRADSDIDVDTNALAISAGIGTGSANVSESTVEGTVNAYIAGSAQVETTGSITVEAISMAHADADTLGVTAGGIAIGVSMAKATVEPDVEAYIGQAAMIDAGNDVELLARADHDAIASAVSSAGGVLAANGSDSRATVSGTLKAHVDNGALVHADNAVTVEASSKASADADAFGVAAGGLAVGVSLAKAVVNPEITTFVGPNATITTTAGDITIRSLHNYDALGNRLTSKLADARATSPSGGLIAVTGAGADAKAVADVDSYADTGSTLIAGRDIFIISRSGDDARAEADGLAIGLLGVGGSLANANVADSDVPDVSSLTKAHANANTTLTAGRNLTILAQSFDAARSTAKASADGVASGAGAGSDSRVFPDVQAFVGSGADIDATNDINITAKAEARSVAEATGAATGLLSAGLSDADARANSLVSASIGELADVDAGHDINVQAIYNFNSSGVGLNDTVQATSSGSAGTLLAGILAGADSNVTSEVTVTTTIGASSMLDAANVGSVVSKAHNSVTAHSTGDADGLFSLGGASATSVVVDVDTTANTIIGSNASLDAGDDLDATSMASSDVTASATGAAGQELLEFFENLFSGNLSDVAIPSILSVGGTAVEVSMDNTANTDIGAGAQLNSNDELNIMADAMVSVDADAAQSSSAVIASDGVSSIEVFVDSDALIRMRNGSGAEGRDVLISARNEIDVNAFADTDVVADLFSGTSTAISRVDIGSASDPSEAKVTLDDNVTIVGRTSLTIEALNNQKTSNIVSKARAQAFGALTSTATTRADGTVQVRSTVVSGAGSSLSSSDLTVLAESAYALDRIPISEADTVVSEIIEVAREVTETVCEWLPWPLDKVCEVVTNIVFDLVAV
ncbi:MAG: hypothetical protein IIC70_07260, partial [Acidobacteria bacterium]|nr:hypothetical protein [Acidobacteriota bacterium]